MTKRSNGIEDVPGFKLAVSMFSSTGMLTVVVVAVDSDVGAVFNCSSMDCLSAAWMTTVAVVPSGTMWLAV